MQEPSEEFPMANNLRNTMNNIILDYKPKYKINIYKFILI